MRKLAVFCVSVVACLVVSPVAEAVFHLMRIAELAPQVAGDTRLQYVELEMTSSGQNLVQGHSVIFLDAAGRETGRVTFGASVADGARGSSVLVATQEFQDRFGVAADLTLPEGIMQPFAGRVVWDETEVDAVAYGDFTGSNDSFGDPASGFPVIGFQSLTLKEVTPPGPGRDNASEYEFRDPTPRNNAGAMGTMPGDLLTTFFADDFTSGNNWNVQTPGAGVDLESCGTPLVADLGRTEFADNRMILTPSAEQFPGLGDTLSFTSLKSDVVEAAGFAEEDYRVTFSMRATEWLEDTAIFARTHAIFDGGVYDPLGTTAAGFNHEILLPGGEQFDSAMFCDGRTLCLQEVDPDRSTPDPIDMNPFLGNEPFLPGTLYNVVLDVTGDDQLGEVGEGSLVARAKIYRAADEEPVGFIQQCKWTAGIGESTGGVDVGVMIAALGDTDRPQEAELPVLEVTDFRITSIPRSQRFVSVLTCERDFVDPLQLNLTWCNPPGAEDRDIVVKVNGEPDDTLPSDAVEHTTFDPEDGDVTVSVINYTGVPAECHQCGANTAPVVVIDGPMSIPLSNPGAGLPAMATATLDSSRSTDGDDFGDDAELSRQWEIVVSPDGSQAALDRTDSVKVEFSADTLGTYVVSLVVSDACPGFDPPAVESADYTIEVVARGGTQRPGDCNQDGTADITDAVCLLGFLFGGSPEVLPCGDGSVSQPGNVALLDCNGDSGIDLSDPVCLLSFLFGGGPAPVFGTDCRPIVSCPDNASRCN